MMKKTLALLLVIAMVASCFVGCGTTNTPAQTENPTTTDAGGETAPVETVPAVEYGPDGREIAAEQIYRTLYTSEVTTMNYLSSGNTYDLVVGANTVDWLVEPDQYGNIGPGLAESWEVSDDGLTWTFHLRQGVNWYDYQGNQMAEVTANDFVAAIRYVCDAANEASNSYLVEDWIVNASEYWAYTAAVLDGFQDENGNYLDGDPTQGEVSIVPAVTPDQIGVEAIDNYTLVYHMCIPRPYFPTALQFGCYWPAPAQLLEELGPDFGTDNTKMWFCGAYILSTYEPQNERVYTKNANYWDAEHVYIEQIIQTYNAEASIIAPEMYLRGEVDYASISAELLDDWLADPEKSQLVSPTRVSNDYSYFFCFNFEPMFEEEYEPANWSIAVNNENFRQSIFHGLDRIRAMSVIYPNNAEDLIENTITPKAFSQYEGKDYTVYGDLAAITARDSFDEAAALQYKEAAVAELTAAGCTFPIKIPISYNSSMTDWGSECTVVEQQLEGLLGADFIDVIVVPGPSTGFLGAIRRTGSYALLKCNWGADYADPETWTDPFTDGNSYNFAYDTTEKFGKNTKTAETMDIIAQYMAMVDEAKAITADANARYEAFAKAEAFYINHAMLIPFGITGGDYQVSKLNLFEGEYSSCGQATSRYKFQRVYTTAMSQEMFDQQYAAWAAAMGLE
jgi:oligopeptide transport system substrate-binding protein